MSNNPSMKEVRGYIRAEAAKAKAWALLGEQVGDVTNLDHTIAERRQQVDGLAKEAASEEAKVADAKKRQAEIIRTAEEKAKEIVSNAERIKTDAERRAEAVDQIVADAKAEAAGLVGEGRRLGEQAAKDAGGVLVQIRADIDAAKIERTQIANDVAALEKRKKVAEADLAKLRDRLAAG